MVTEGSSGGGRVSTAAYAFAAALSLGCAAIPADAESQAVQRIGKYCAKSWQNAGIARPEWQDCTQEVFAQLLADVERDRLPTALADRSSQERRLLNRAIWRTAQRWRRAVRPLPLADPQPGNDRTADRQLELADEVASVLEHLSRRQRRILVLWSEGWSVRDIADELGLSAARVSDEKYKALYKLRQVFAEHGPENGDRVRST